MSERDRFGVLEVDEGDFNLYVTDDDGNTTVILEATGDEWSEVYSREIVKRFNACAGMSDPAAEIAYLRSDLAAAMAALDTKDEEIARLREENEWMSALIIEAALDEASLQAALDAKDATVQMLEGRANTYALAIKKLGEDRDRLKARAEGAERILSRLSAWTHQYGAALCPGSCPDTFGEGMRKAKDEIRAHLAALEQEEETKNQEDDNEQR